MKYTPSTESIPQSSRRAVNEKLLYLIDNNCCEAYGITKQDVFQGYTGDGACTGFPGRTIGATIHTVRQKRNWKTASSLHRPPCVGSWRIAFDWKRTIW